MSTSKDSPWFIQMEDPDAYTTDVINSPTIKNISTNTTEGLKDPTAYEDMNPEIIETINQDKFISSRGCVSRRRTGYICCDCRHLRNSGECDTRCSARCRMSDCYGSRLLYQNFCSECSPIYNRKVVKSTNNVYILSANVLINDNSSIELFVPTLNIPKPIYDSIFGINDSTKNANYIYKIHLN